MAGRPGLPNCSLGPCRYSMSTDERKALDAEAATEGGDGSTGPNYDLLVPLLYAPLLPLMVVGKR
jgi:hypothetical protein